MPYISIGEARQRAEELKGKKFGHAHWTPGRLTANDMNLIADRFPVSLYEPHLVEMERIEMGYGNTQIKYVGESRWVVYPDHTVMYFAD